MNEPSDNSNTDPSPGNRPYRSMPLLQLLIRIAEDGDRLALHEVHMHRRLFQTRGKTLVLDSFVHQLCSTMGRANQTCRTLLVLDLARDLTIDRFYNIPSATDASTQASSDCPKRPKRKGADCRRYYKHFLKVLADNDIRPVQRDSLHTEEQICTLLKAFVKRHFHLSLKEARRRLQEMQVRHKWQVNSGVIRVWMPRSLTAKERTAWLTDNVPHPDPSHRGEKMRVQKIIDEHFVLPQTLSLHQPDGQPLDEPDTRSTTSFASDYGISMQGLAQAVANEKAEHIGEQRTTIRAMGREILKAMIHRIFTVLAAGQYNDSKIAGEFGLTKTAFSHFASSRWLWSKRGRIPDLWKNTAGVFARNPLARQALIDMGLWSMVQKFIADDRDRKDKHNE